MTFKRPEHEAAKVVEYFEGRMGSFAQLLTEVACSRGA